MSDQHSLLVEKRFLPFFLTQFFGAFNDNLFKNALAILIVFQGTQISADQVHYLVNLSAAIFILPFFLFSSTAGQISDAREKSRLIRQIKTLELVIGLLGAIGFLLQSVTWLIFVLFLMGTQSALFGPVKYSYLPQHLAQNELTSGNGLIETGTFMAILLGMILGSQVMSIDQKGMIVSILIIVVAAVGLISARQIPLTPALDSGKTINWNIYTQTVRVLKLTTGNRSVFYAILAISWFWFLGATYLVQLPNYTREMLGGKESVYILLLALFCIGISIGSITCAKISKGKIEPRLIPFGALGVSLFGIDLYFSLPPASGVSLIEVGHFIQQSAYWRALADMVFIGFFSGIYIVPLYTVVQKYTDGKILSQVIAGNNILNACMMVLAAGFAVAILSYWDEQKLFLLISIVNLPITGVLLWPVVACRPGKTT